MRVLNTGMKHFLLYESFKQRAVICDSNIDKYAFANLFYLWWTQAHGPGLNSIVTSLNLLSSF